MGSPSLTIMNGVELDIAGDLTDASGLIIIDGGKLDVAGDAIFSRSITLTTATSEIEVDGATTLGGDPYVLDI